MIRAVIFDLDDTLISEKKYIESGYWHLSKLLSERYNKEGKELYQLLINLFNESTKNVFNRLFDKLGIPYTNNHIMNLVEEYRNHLPSIQFYDDVLPCLKDLKKKGLKVGVITDGYANAQRQKLKAINAFEYFDEIIITDELGREYWKPHPKAFEVMREKLKIDFKEMVYVGDNPEKDFYISNIYPVKTFRILRVGVYTDRSYLGNIMETYSSSSLKDFCTIIDL